MRSFILKFAAKIFVFLRNCHRDYQITLYRQKYSISKSFRFNGHDITLYGQGKIILGDNSYIGAGSTWQAGEGCTIKVGNSCRISHNVRAYTYSSVADADFSLPDLPKRIGDVIICDYVWIGANVFINPGVTIGDNSVVGANSVVVKDIPANSIYGGVPAKLIRFKNLDNQADPVK